MKNKDDKSWVKDWELQEIKKIYQLIALNELPLLKWTHTRVKYLTALTWLLVLLLVGLVVLNSVVLGIMTDTIK